MGGSGGSGGGIGDYGQAIGGLIGGSKGSGNKQPISSVGLAPIPMPQMMFDAKTLAKMGPLAKRLMQLQMLANMDLVRPQSGPEQLSGPGSGYTPPDMGGPLPYQSNDFQWDIGTSEWGYM